MTHQLPNACRALEPYLREKVTDARFWDGEYDTTHTGEIDVPPMDEAAQKAMWEAPTWAEWDTVHVAVENYVGAGVFPAEDDGRYQWGEEVVLVSQSIDEA